MFTLNFPLTICIIGCHTVFPRFVTPLGDQTVWEHEDSEFKCKVNDDEFLVAWFVGGRKVEETEKYHLIKKGCFHTLIINDTLKEEEGQIKAALGVDTSSTANLTVRGTISCFIFIHYFIIY